MVTTRRYSITAVAAMMTDLEAWIEQSSDTLNNEEAKDYPSEDRLDNLNTRIDALQAAYDALADIEPA